jgi:hypothetical protein
LAQPDSWQRFVGEVYLKIAGRMVYLWRAVDAEGEVVFDTWGLTSFGGVTIGASTAQTTAI